LIEVTFQQQTSKQLPPLFVQDIGTVNDNESNSGHRCQSKLECDAESKALGICEVLQRQRPETGREHDTDLEWVECEIAGVSETFEMPIQALRTLVSACG